MDLPVVRAAQRYGEFIAYLATKRSGLGKAKVVRIARGAGAYQAGLSRHEVQMLAIANAAGLWERQHALVDPRRFLPTRVPLARCNRTCRRAGRRKPWSLADRFGLSAVDRCAFDGRRRLRRDL
jgi:hypothetical protein